MIISNCQVDVDSSSGASDFKGYAGHSNRQPCDALLAVMHNACIYHRHLFPTHSTQLNEKKREKKIKTQGKECRRVLDGREGPCHQETPLMPHLIFQTKFPLYEQVIDVF
jgi:hypothetical protein